MGYSVEVNEANYQTEVVKASYEKIVLIDFFATWCGPCQLLKPILEKLVQEYDFVLAKVNIDESQALARQFGVEGVPDVRIVKKGEMVPGFVGALSESQLRELLGKLNLQSDLETGLEQVRKAIASQDAQGAKQLFDKLFATYPNHPRVALEAAKFLVKVGRLDEAQAMLKMVEAGDRNNASQVKAIQALIQFKQAAQDPGESDLDRLFSQAARSVLTEDYETALQLFLEIVQESRKYRSDGGRKAMVSVFELLGNEHPLTQKYQQELMLALY